MGAFFAIPLVRKIGIGLVVAVILGGIAGYELHKAKEAGKDEGRQAAAQDMKADAEKLRVQAKQEFEVKLGDLNEKIAQYEKDRQADRAREIETLQTLANISQQKSVAAASLAKTSDPDLHGKIAAALGRAPGNLSTGYTASEEREIAQCLLVDRPSCQAESAAHSDQAEALGGQIAQMHKEVQALNDKFAALGAYTTRVEQSYVQIFNAFPKKGNRLISLFTLGRKGKPKKLPYPDPQELFGKKEK
jgi:hypothetical protein